MVRRQLERPTQTPEQTKTGEEPPRVPQLIVEETGRRKDPFDASWKERALVLGSVFGVLLAAIFLGLQFAAPATKVLLFLVPASFFAAGKFLPLAPALPQLFPNVDHQVLSTFTSFELGIVIGIMDTCTVLLIVYSFEAVCKIPFMSRLLHTADQNAQLLLKAYPRFKKIAVAGTVLFVLFPIAGTGAIGGTILGALLGLHRYTLIACVSFGGFLGGLSMAYAADNFLAQAILLRENEGNPWVLGTIAMVAGLLLLLLARVYKRALSRAREMGG